MTAPASGDQAHRQIVPPVAPLARRRRITLARVIMWAMGLAVLAFSAVFIFQISVFQSNQQPVTADKPVEDPKASIARGVSFTGYDSGNQPFTIRSGRASQDKAAPSRVLLEDVTIEMSLKSKDELLKVTAEKGIFDDKAKTLDLEGDIIIVNSSNYTAHMERAQVLLRDKRLTSRSPVEVKFPTGTITAGGMEMRDDGQEVEFTDTARAVFSERSARGDASQQKTP